VERERKMERKFYFGELSKTERRKYFHAIFFFFIGVKEREPKIIERVLFVFQFFKLFQEKKRTTNVEVI